MTIPFTPVFNFCKRILVAIHRLYLTLGARKLQGEKTVDGDCRRLQNFN